MPPVDNTSLNGSRPSRSVISGAMEMIVGADIPFIKPGGKRSRVRSAFDDGGRLSTAFRRIVAKMPFLDLHERQEHNAEEHNAEEENAEDSLDLCRRCKGIDLDIFNSDNFTMGYCEMVLTLGILDEDSPCALCRFFYSMRRPSLTGETTKIYHLCRYLFEFPDPFGIWPKRYVWVVDPDSEWQESESADRDQSSYQDMSDRPHSLFLPQSTQPYTHPEASLKGLPVCEATVNYPLLRHWIKECEGHPNCSYFSIDPTKSDIGPTIRGIDCTTRKIVDLRPGDSYVALSYVWGNQPLLENKSSRVLPTNAPKVIEDAMVVVKELGQQYLWVDQYCIDQHDDRDKHAQIKIMDRIYEGSHATIVAFSGVDSSSGLPGVSGPPRIPQPRFTSSKVTLLGFTPSISRQSLAASIWMKRGWTFQEGLLSRRLLIFTQEQVYFVCSRGWCDESSVPSPTMTYQSQKSGYGYGGHFSQIRDATESISPLIRSPSQESLLIAAFYPFLDLIERFTQRQLSFQSDALDAVRGLLSRVDIITYWGIPVLHFRDYRRGDLQIASETFLQCLLWQPNGAATEAEYLGRREGFPSWSWLGWGIPITYRCVLYDDDDDEMRSTVKIEDKSGALLSLSDLFKQSGIEMERSRMLPERTIYLWLEGLVLTLGFQPVGNRHDGEICFCFKHPLGHLFFRKCMCARDSKYNEVSFRLDVKGSEEIWKATLVKKWSCLWIYSIYGRHEFLILDEGDDAAYCVGTLRLVDPTEDKSMLDNLKAKVPHDYRKVRIG